MNLFVPAFLLLFVTSSMCFTAKGQLPRLIDTTTIDPPVNDSTSKEDDFPFYREAFEPEFRGGVVAWLKFLKRNLKYPRAAWKANIQGTVVVRFVVNADGKISDIEALSGPEELRQAAIDVIRKSPRWVPIKNVKSIKGIKKQPINFKVVVK